MNVKEESLRFLSEHKKAILNLGMGFGKTRILLEHLKSLKDNQQVLILVPKSILKQWLPEMALFGKSEWRKDYAFGQIGNCDVFVKSQHSLKKETDQFATSLIVIDEPKLFKSKDNQLYQVLKQRFERGRMIWLDGTLLENTDDERIAIAEVFGVNPRDLRDVVFHRDVAAPRKIVRRTVWIPMPKGMIPMERYVEMELMRAFERGQPNYINAAVSNLRLFLSEFGEPNQPELPGDRKLEIVKDILAKHPGAKFIVHTHTLEAMRRVAEGVGAVCFHGALSANQRKEILDDFNSGKISGIVATLAGCRGIDLPSGEIVITFTVPWTYAAWKQQDRVTRKSSDLSKVTYHYTLMFKNSGEEVILSILEQKKELNENFRGEHGGGASRIGWRSFLHKKHSNII